MSGVEVVLSMLDKVKSVRRQGPAAVGCTSVPPTMIAIQVTVRYREGHDGKVLMTCLRGCEFNEILSALGVTYQQINPSEPFEVDRVQRARDFWDNAGDGVRHHPYAYKKLHH